MKRVARLVEIPGLDEEITKAVKDFAGSQGLEFEAWYQDQPVWLLYRSESPFVRQVQIETLESSGRRELVAMPDLYEIEEGKGVYREVKELKDDEILSRDLNQLIREFNRDPDKARARVTELLKEVWEKAKALKTDRLV